MFYKITIIVVLYFLTNYTYKKIDWHSKQPENKLQKLISYLSIIFFGLPMFYSFVVFVFVVFFQELIEYIESRNNFEQVILVFGLIVFYFFLKIYLEKERNKIKEKDNIIESQKNEIRELNTKIRFLENN